MRAADSNVVIRLLVKDKANEVALAEGCLAAGIWLSHIVLVETAWVLESFYGRSAAQAVEAIELLLGHAQITVEAPDLVRAAVALAKAHKGIDFADGLILESARRAGMAPLATFDRKFGRLDGTEWLLKGR